MANMQKFCLNSPEQFFDEEGFINTQVITYYLNHLADRVYAFSLKEEQMTNRATECEKNLERIKMWIAVLKDWEYVKLNTNEKEKVNVWKNEMGNALEEIKEILRNTDIYSNNFNVNDMRPEEFVMALNKEFCVSHIVNGVRRWAFVTKCADGLVLNSLSLQEEPCQAKVIALPSLFEICSSNNIGSTVFLDLKWDDQVQVRVHIDMIESFEFQKQFTDRCFFGQRSTLLKGSFLSSILTETDAEIAMASHNSSGATPKLKRNVVYTVGEGLFALTNKGLPSEMVLGVVSKGLAVLEMILRNCMSNNVIIEESGLIIHKV
ncbi:UNVERIFIED_CONTAM: hypothetical protein RMT77_009080 [Armadillidium vulgare]